MVDLPIDIEYCPQPLVADALTLLMRDLPASHRQAFIAAASEQQQPGLFIAHQGQTILGACWAQPQPGSTAIFWTPKLARSVEKSLAEQLIEKTMADLDSRGCGLSQVLLNQRDDPQVPLLESHHFSYLAELLYLGATPTLCNAQTANATELEFEDFQLSAVARLKDIIQRTYDQTLDCPALDGARPMNEVIAGYMATGVFEPNLWKFIRHEEQDVGVLLLTEHRENGNWELVYMGLVPEVRGNSWGLAIVRHAQHLAAQQSAPQLVLAVDAANSPAVKMYEMAGFSVWDRRHVMVRLPQTS